MQNNMLMNMLLGKLRVTNPQAYQECMNYINSGRNPNDVINELLRTGRFTQEQVQQAQHMMNTNTSNNYTPNNNIKRF